jgi:RNA 3'-terminal phosphate cyclase (ATP)
MIALDGSEGEGGGQILRSALALSILTGKPFKLIHIRANRKPPGLRPQHAVSVKAAAAISGAKYKGGSVGSETLYFEPDAVVAGQHTFTIGTAGSTGLVLHTVYLPLALKGGKDSELTITGGTHVKTSPTFDYNRSTWAAHLRRMGIGVEVEMVRPGFYPRGGGEIKVAVRPCPRVNGLMLVSCPPLTTAGGFAAVAGLGADIAERMARRLGERMKRAGLEPHIEQQKWSGWPGAVCGVVFRQPPVPATFTAVGEPGRPAEVVADHAADQAIAFKEAGCPVDPHAADQIVLPLALSPDASEYRVSEVTRHLTTNIAVIRRFLDRDITCDGDEGSPGTVRIPAAGSV